MNKGTQTRGEREEAKFASSLPGIKFLKKPMRSRMIAEVAIGIGKTINPSRAAAIPRRDQIRRIRGISVARKINAGVPKKVSLSLTCLCPAVYASPQKMKIKPTESRA